MHTKETMRQNAAFQGRAEFTLDKAGHVPVPFALSGQESLQVSGDDSIQRVFFRISGPVDGIDGHEGIDECNALPIHPRNGDSNLQQGLRGKSGWTAIISSRLFPLCRFPRARPVVTRKLKHDGKQLFCLEWCGKQAG